MAGNLDEAVLPGDEARQKCMTGIILQVITVAIESDTVYHSTLPFAQTAHNLSLHSPYNLPPPLPRVKASLVAAGAGTLLPQNTIADPPRKMENSFFRKFISGG